MVASSSSARRALLLLLLSFAASAAKPVTFSNVLPRLDATGSIIDAHDGTTRRYSPGGPFFYHAMSYGLCKETGKIDGCTGDCI